MQPDAGMVARLNLASCIVTSER